MNRAESTIRPRRSLLFVPGLRPDRYAKALDAGADIVCVDLEDAVALDRKDEGRELTMPLFGQDTHPHVERMVRINSITTLHGSAFLILRTAHRKTAPSPGATNPDPAPGHKALARERDQKSKPKLTPNVRGGRYCEV